MVNPTNFRRTVDSLTESIIIETGMEFEKPQTVVVTNLEMLARKADTVSSVNEIDYLSGSIINEFNFGILAYDPARNELCLNRKKDVNEIDVCRQIVRALQNQTYDRPLAINNNNMIMAAHIALGGQESYITYRALQLKPEHAKALKIAESEQTQSYRDRLAGLLMRKTLDCYKKELGSSTDTWLLDLSGKHVRYPRFFSDVDFILDNMDRLKKASVDRLLSSTAFQNIIQRASFELIRYIHNSGVSYKEMMSKAPSAIRDITPDFYRDREIYICTGKNHCDL